jgi:hypothetical protein
MFRCQAAEPASPRASIEHDIPLSGFRCTGARRCARRRREDHDDFTDHLHQLHDRVCEGEGMRNALVLLASLASLGRTAEADSFDRRWPELPEQQEVELGKVVAERLVDAGNRFFASHVDLLSHDILKVRIDGERKAAKVGVGAGYRSFLALRVAGDVEVVDGTARISSRLAVALAGKQLSVRLPAVDVAATEYKGERGVELRLPLVRRQF